MPIQSFEEVDADPTGGGSETVLKRIVYGLAYTGTYGDGDGDDVNDRMRLDLSDWVAARVSECWGPSKPWPPDFQTMMSLAAELVADAIQLQHEVETNAAAYDADIPRGEARCCEEARLNWIKKYADKPKEGGS